MALYEKTNQKEENAPLKTEPRSSGGIFLIVAGVVLAGLTIAAAVIFKDKAAKPTTDQSSSQSANLAPKADQKIQVDTTGMPSLGDANAPVTIVEISDFACPFCALVGGFRDDVRQSLIADAKQKGLQEQVAYWETFVPPLPGIKENYVNTGKVKLVFMFNPIHGQISADSGSTALCAGKEEKFWEMHDVLFEKQSDWSVKESTESAVLFKSYATDLELTATEFNSCFDTQEFSSVIMQNYSEAQNVFTQLKEAGLTQEGQAGLGTPTYLINGRYLPGAQPFSEFQKIIEEELTP